MNDPAVWLPLLFLVLIMVPGFIGYAREQRRERRRQQDFLARLELTRVAVNAFGLSLGMALTPVMKRAAEAFTAFGESWAKLKESLEDEPDD